jgi:glycosyltransferase involved in cell wall biosynthesis
MGSADRITYAKEAADLLSRHQPSVVVVWDDYKLAPFLRASVDLTSAIVLSQHGRSYHLSQAGTRDLYRLETLDAVITLTRASYEADRARTYAYEPLVLVRPNGVDTARFTPTDEADRRAARASFSLPEEGRIVLALARLAPSKGAHLLLHSWPRVLEDVPDAVLWLVGGGDDRYVDRLRRTAQRLDVADAVRFEGPVGRDEVNRCHAAADLYVFPSIQDEGHPLSLLEAMSSGLACVSADSPVVRELHAGAVALVDHPGVQDAFVPAIVELLHDEQARHTLGQRAREQVEARFSLAEYLDELTAFLARLARSRGGR